MKRFLSWMLCLVMVLSLSGAAMAESLEPVKFTITSTHSNSDMDYTSDALYQFIADKFQFAYEVYPVSKDSQSEKIRIWINGGTMPDVVCWRNFDYQEYLTYGEQGLLKELPEGWEETYPELYNMYKACGIYEQLAIDGKYYGIPHSTYYRFANMEDPVVQHATLYYRKDWAEKLGFEFGAYVTMSDLAAYLRACIDNDMVGNGNTLGLSDNPGAINNLFGMFSDYNYDQDAFYRDETGYHWIMQNPNFAKGMEMGRQWYNEGLLDPDYYLLSMTEATANFTSGLSAAMFESCSIPSNAAFRSTFEEGTGLSADNIGLAAIASDDGVVQANQTDNYWSLTMFSPDIDDAVFERILQLIDWTCSEEGELTIMVGLKGEAWDYAADGSIQVLLQPDEKGKYSSSQDLYNSFQVFRSLGVIADDYSFINPSYQKDVVEQIQAIFAAKKQGKINKIDYDYKFFTSDSKADYSVDIESEMTYLIIKSDVDIQQEVDSFVEKNASIWQPVVDDLNEAFVQ